MPRPPSSTLFPYTTLFRSDFVETVFEVVGIHDWESYVQIDPVFYRLVDPQTLVGDPTHLQSLGWKPTVTLDRKSTRLNSSHVENSYAVLCLKKKRGCSSVC